MNSKIMIISKANPYAASDPIPDVCIEIVGTLPEMWTTLDEWDNYCDGEARQLEEALVHTLPGSTYDRLAGRMLMRKASHLRVPRVRLED